MKKQHGLWFHIFDVVLNIVIILAIVGVIRTFIVSPFQVEGDSMLSTLENQEYIIINKFDYLLDEPDRGDVVVFRPPNDPSKHYVKRVIGLPGETVVIRDGYVFIEKEGVGEFRLEENYLNERNSGQTYRNPPNSGDTSEIRYPVPKDSYFLLGDNRRGSQDSRFFGDSDPSLAAVPEENIKGRVWFIALPISKIHALEPPEYAY